MTLEVTEKAGRPTVDAAVVLMRRRPARAAKLSALVRRSWRAYWERRARLATWRLLASLDERALRDIGLSASEIESVVYGGPDRSRTYSIDNPSRCGAKRHSI